MRGRLAREMDYRKVQALEKIADALVDIDKVLRKHYIYDKEYDPQLLIKSVKPDNNVERANDIPDDH